jgi:hypothetical protein
MLATSTRNDLRWKTEQGSAAVVILICVAICCQAETESIPVDVRKYFERQEAVFEKSVLETQDALKSKKAEAAGVLDSRKKAILEAQAKKLRVQLQDLEKIRLEAKPDLELFSGLNGVARVGQIGLLPPCKLKAAVDGVPVMKFEVIYGRTVVLQDVDVKSIHLAKLYRSDALWIVRAVSTKEVRLKPYLEGSDDGSGYYFVSPMNRKEVAKFREIFDSALDPLQKPLKEEKPDLRDTLKRDGTLKP